jgi:hypothetical protein
LFAAIVALLGVVNQVFGPHIFRPKLVVVPTLSEPGVPSVVSKLSVLENCFKPKMITPETVSISKWNSMKLKLTGRNDCLESLVLQL